jgi:16S rRNA (adenine1518-N6/adenine1519-N6)-dimethyltransferase
LTKTLRSRGVIPRKSLGQNFLTDDAMAQRIVAAAQIAPHNTVIEIGAGAGALTKHLARQARRVLAVELDQQLIPILREELAGFTNVLIVHDDALEIDFARLIRREAQVQTETGDEIRVVANLPYYITSAVIRRILESEVCFASIILTMQFEVAQRIVAGPGEMSLLAVSVQFYGRPELLWRIPPSAFYPQPDVDSAVLRITPFTQPRPVNRDLFFKWVKAAFSQPRKQLRNTLSAGLGIGKAQVEEILLACGIDPGRRAESLGMNEWIRLVQAAQLR